MKTEYIYVIDDNDLICHAIKFLLESLNFKVKYYQNPLNFLQQDTTQLRGCLIVDLFMPHMSGFELIKRLRMSNNLIKIIAISGNISSDTERRVVEEGAQSFFTKPFDTDHLLNEIFHLLAK